MAQVYLVGIDCSNCSDRALQFAAEAAATNESKVVIAHIIEWSPYSFNTNEENAERHKRREAELDRAHKEIVDPLVDKLRGQGVDAEGAIRHGHIAKSLKALADHYDASSIIVGHHGESGLLKQFFGSVPGALIQIADRPVTVVP